MTWETVPLGREVRLVGGGTPSKSRADYYGGEIPWITSADISERGAIVNRTTLTALGADSNPGRVVAAGSVLLVTRTGVGKTAITERPLAFSQDIVAFECHEGLDAGYLRRFLEASAPKLRSKARGATILGVTRDDVLSLPIPKLPLPEQRRIAAILDEADALRQSAASASAAAVELRRALYAEALRGESVARAPIGSFATVRTGATPPRSDEANFGGGIPWVKTGEVRGVIRSTDETVSEAGARSARLTMFPAGSVVVAMYGQGATRGRSGILGIDATTNQACAVIPPNDQFDARYLHAALVDDYERLRDSAAGGNQPNLNLTRVADFAIRFPPLAAQRHFGEQDARIQTWIERAQGRRDRLDALFASLQHRAFRGEL